MADLREVDIADPPEVDIADLPTPAPPRT